MRAVGFVCDAATFAHKEHDRAPQEVGLVATGVGLTR